MENNKSILFLIIILSVIIGIQFFKLYCKRRQDIIKIAFFQDSLPPATTGTNWVQGGSCFMKDGKTGVVKGINCIRTEVL